MKCFFCLGFVRQVLGGFWEGSRQFLAGSRQSSAESRQILGSFSFLLALGSVSEVLEGVAFRFVAQKPPKEAQEAPRMGKKRPRGMPKASHRPPNTIKNEAVFAKRFQMTPRVPTRTFLPSFRFYF